MPPTKIVLSSGREVAIDLYKMTISEWRATSGQSEEENDALMAKCVGMAAAEISELPFPDHVLLVREFLKAVRDPLSDPN